MALAETGSVAPGTLLESSLMPVELWPAHCAAAYRILYQGIGYLGEPQVVSGAVYKPRGEPPADGWRVVSYAHGTTGLEDAHAPSLTGLSKPERLHVNAWLATGYVVAATDYEGLSTPGPHPYFNGEAVADDVVDIVRAARQLVNPTNRSWIVAGFSQGAHAALFTALIATKYAPELEFRGVVAIAPPVELPRVIMLQTRDETGPPPLIAVFYIAGMREDVDQSFLTAAGHEMIRFAATASLREVYSALRQTTNGHLGMTHLGDRDDLMMAVKRARVPISIVEVPYFLAVGSEDELVPIEITEQWATKLGKAGNSVSYTRVEGATHAAMATAADTLAVTWAKRAFDETLSGLAGRSSDDRGGFNLLDLTGDGSISEDDYEVLALRLVQACGEPLGSPRATAVRTGYRALWEALAAAADKDGDGAVTEAEYFAFLRSCSADTLAAIVAPAAEAVIAMVDGNGDGKVDRDELTRLLGGYDREIAEASSVFDQLDRDSDGFVTREEIIKAIMDFCRDPRPDRPGQWFFGRIRPPTST